MEPQALIQEIAQRLQPVDGLVAIALGGSRARGTHTATSDIDLGLYYDPAKPPDIAMLRQIAAALDDRHRPELITPLGGWGPWINGGGWLIVQGIAVDFLYRDISKVNHIVDSCCAGQLEIVYQPGHPHGFVTSIYMAEIAHCQPLWDPMGALSVLKTKTEPYPTALRQATFDKFWWEAQFSLDVAQKAADRGDVSYIAGCCFRTVASLMQTLFALNRQYLMNEKGAVALAATFPLTIPDLQPRVHSVFTALSDDPAHLHHALITLNKLVEEISFLLEADVNS